MTLKSSYFSICSLYVGHLKFEPNSIPKNLGGQGLEGWIRIGSIAISYCSIIFGLSHVLASDYGNLKSEIKIQDIIKSGLIIITDVSLILSMISFCIIYFPLWITLGILAIYFIIGHSIQSKFITKYENESQAAFLLKVSLFVLTNMPINRMNHSRKAITFNKLTLNIVITTGLAIITCLLKATAIITVINDGEFFHHLYEKTCANICVHRDLSSRSHEQFAICYIGIWNTF